MRKQKKIISAISAFLLSMAMVLCLAIPTLYVSVLSQGSILETLEKVNYYGGVQKNLLEKAGDFLIPTGLSEKVLEGAFPEEDIKEIVKGQIQGTGSVESTQIIETKNKAIIKNNIKKYLREIEVAEGEVSEEQLDEIIDALIEDFQKYASFPFVAQLLRVRDLYKMAMWIVLGVCLLLGAGIIFFIYKISGWKHILFRYIAYSFGSVFFMLALIPFVIRIVRIYERVHISPPYVYYFCVQHIQKGLDSLIGCGIVALVCMIVSAVLSEKIRKKLTSK